MKIRYIVGLSIIIGFGILGILGSGILFFICVPSDITAVISAWVGITGTLASIILSIAAICYSNKASKDAEESLKKVTDNYKTLCDEISRGKLANSIGSASIENFIKEQQEIIAQESSKGE